ncbi:MAG: hypothetical protein WCK58_18860, partial [Chloroflexota bacterium]
NDVAGVLLGIVGAIYGIMLAFVVVTVWSSFADAEHNVRREATYAAQVLLDTEGLDVSSSMSAEVRAYVHDVVELEWPLMTTGKPSGAVDADIVALFATLRSSNPATQSQAGFHTAAINDLNDLLAARRDRLFAAQEELPAVLQDLIYGGALLLVAFTWLFGMRRYRAQLLMVMGVAALVGFCLLVVVVFDHPFSGDITVSNGPFHLGVLAPLW